MATRLGYEVQVVEHQHERLAALDAGVDERRQHDLLERRRDEHDRRVSRGRQAVEQHGTIDDAGSQRRRGQLARDDTPALGGRAGR
jgi:hypothetical protein